MNFMSGAFAEHCSKVETKGRLDPDNAKENHPRVDYSREEFVAAVAEMAASVFDFHQRFDVPSIARLPQDPDGLAVLRSRLAFLVEETGEHAKELNRGELGDASTEMADVAFVAMGTLLVLDRLGGEALRSVAAKNNAKTLETHLVDETSGKLVRKVLVS